MDILKARKKAAEQKNAGQKSKNQLPAVAQEQTESSSPAMREKVSFASSPPSVPVPPAELLAPVSQPELPAAKFDVGEQDSDEIELLSFMIGAERYALPIKEVREILKNRELTVVPNAPAYIAGVTSLRGTVLPVIDPCKRLQVPAGRRDEKSRIIVVSSEEELVGVIIDRVTGVIRIMPQELKELPENIEAGAEFLRGIVRQEDTLYIVLDSKKITGA